MLRSRKGFTLIELLICAFIIAILLSIVVPFIAGVGTTVTDSSPRVEVMTQEQEAAMNEKVTTEPSAPEEKEVKSTDKGKDNAL